MIILSLKHASWNGYWNCKVKGPYIMHNISDCSDLLPWDWPYLPIQNLLISTCKNSLYVKVRYICGKEEGWFLTLLNLLHYCPKNTLCTWWNCKRTNVSIVFSTSKLDGSWANNPQINNISFICSLDMVQQLVEKRKSETVKMQPF